MRTHLCLKGLAAAVLVLGLAQSGCSNSAYCFADCGDTTGGKTDGGTDGGGGTGGTDGGIYIDGSGGNADGDTDATGPCTVTNGGSEICDGIDNDCNGVVDDDFDMHDKAHCGTCDNNCVTQMINAEPDSVTCDWDGTAGTPGTCGFADCLQDWYDVDGDPTNGCEYPCVKNATDDTLCNNRDDDCDGLRDEDVDLCTSVTDCGRCGGACVVLHGTPTCDHPDSGPCDSTNTRCVIATCNDDDNDGQPDWWDLDNSYATGCEYHCSKTNGGIEICGDGIDNDCDGKIDGADDDLTGDPQLGQPCFGDPDGICGTPAHAGLTACKGQKVECQGPDVIVAGQVLETCNGLDDDCNGTVDDHLTDVGKSCGTSNIFPCALGSEQCVGAQLTCIGAVEPGVEVCNGMDDDCDGQIDDNATDAVGSCGQTDEGECALGTKTCTGGVVLCVGEIDPAPETCNAKDDDCDGQVDNAPTDIGGTCGKNNTAPCSFGKYACDNGVLTCVGNLDPSPEACNGVDDDCNGVIDDNVPGAGVACGQSDSYPCKKGVMQCQGGAMLCVGAVEPKPELCNGEDDNCNGVIDDNTTDSGGDCGQSSAAPCHLGKLECKAGALVCSGNVDPVPEVCNGKDDDCDGQVDNDPSGIGADCGKSNTAPCQYGKTQCLNGALTCVGNTDPVAEDCNGKDDDCDGAIDNNPTGTGQSCGKSGVFPCAFGSMQCQSGAMTCVGFADPNPEVCNGVDDDCDGVIDNNLTDLSGDCGQSNVGACKYGTKACVGGELVCQGFVDPKPELCNNLDDDCDGTVDNNPTDIGASCGTNNTAPCKFGTIQCTNGTASCVGAIEPSAETCNGIDDNCNGAIDDGMPGAGVACGQSNTYPCKKGAMQCQGGAMVCVGAVNPKVEVCNGIDDNCNGVIDDSTTDSGGTCGLSGTAPCKLGVLECQSGALKCAGNIDPKDETCNGKDDDCDGTIDDNVPGTNADCGLSNTAPCTYGKTACQNGAMVCAGNVDPVPETCNAKDDDCNGLIDDNPTGTGQSCGVSNSFPCAFGSMQCQGGTMTCVGNSDPKPETCNGVDDDCDGVIDNNLTDLTGTCGQSNVGACKYGTKACVGGAIVCQGHVDPKPELCNKVDDDCDGTVDNNPTDVGASCGTNNTAPCKFGTIQCTNGTATCVGAIEPAAESCNGLDDNCNGVIDDGVPGAGVACGQSSTYPCKKGAMQCQGGAMICVGAVDPKSETCNGVDDNCNGVIDDNTTDSGGSCGLSNTAPCKLGALQCQAGTLVCVGNIDPKNETCNGVDDNCNGSIDDNVPGTNADCGQNNTAPCHYGKIQCQGGSMVCVGALNPSTETCNGIDDNCNGLIDDATQGSGQPCGASNTFPCSYGTMQCQSGTLSCVGNVDPKTETCNGLDDDCDGQIDLTGSTPPSDSVGPCDVRPAPPPGATSPCKAGTKACQGGTVVCVGSVGPTGTQDTCGVDANCDGLLTNQPDLQTDVRNCGSCGNDCLAGAVHANWACNTGSCRFQGCQIGYWDLNHDNKCEYACTFVSAQEACNGVDDNCDGNIDEGVVAPSPVQICGVSPSATTPECTTGVSVTCTSTGWKCTFPAGVCGPTCATATEICDALDNNCNGLVNENVSNWGKPCASDDAAPGTQGVCRTTGTFVCNGPSATVCSATEDTSKVAPEDCDGLDNDCDGSTDEPFTAKGSNATYFVKPAVTRINTSLWIYSYEASRPNATTASPGSGNGYTCTSGCPSGVPAAPSGIPLQATKSCSVATKVPWFNVTPIEAEQNCSQMGGHICMLAEWQRACITNPPGTTTCKWGYAPNGTACNTALGPPYTFPFPPSAAKWCNLGPTFDFGKDSGNGDQDGLLPTASTDLKDCWGDWTALLSNGTTNGKIFDLTGNLREITESATNVYKLMGGAFNTGAESGASCDFTFYTTDQNFQYFDLGFRCCFSTDPRL